MGFFDKLKSSIPGVPKVPGIPKVPGVPNMPGVPKMPGMPGVPNMPQADQQAAATPPDANDPVMEPIEEITVEKFAEISGKLTKNGIMELEKVTPFVEANGIKPGTWTTVQSGWMQRIQGNQQLQLYYNSLFTKHMS